MFIIKLQESRVESSQVDEKMMKIVKRGIQRSLENMNTSNGQKYQSFKANILIVHIILDKKVLKKTYL